MVVEECFWMSDTLQKLWSQLLWKWCLWIIWYLKTVFCIPYNLHSWTYWLQYELWDRWLSFDKNFIGNSVAYLYCLQWLWRSVCEYQILYRNYDHSCCDNDVCGTSFIEKHSSAYHTVYLHVGVLSKIFFNKSFFFTSVEVSWEYICSNSIFSRQKSSSEMMYSEQLKYVRLMKNIALLMIKT